MDAKELRSCEDIMNIEELCCYLIRCCYWYYVKAEPVIGDETYDRLLHILEAMEQASDWPMGRYQMVSPTDKIWGDSEGQYWGWAKQKPTPEDHQAASNLLGYSDERL